jgi:hypothetical protein
MHNKDFKEARGRKSIGECARRRRVERVGQTGISRQQTAESRKQTANHAFCIEGENFLSSPSESKISAVRGRALGRATEK